MNPDEEKDQTSQMLSASAEEIKPMGMSMALLLKDDGRFAAMPQEGGLIEGTVIDRSNKEIYVDLGFLGTGIIYGKELMEAYDIAKKLKAGDRVVAKIVELENDDGYVELSLKEASRQRFWDELKEKQRSGEMISVKITEANRGGLVALVSGIKAFLPVSQLTPKHYPRIEGGDKEKILIELQKFIGQDLKVKIIDTVPEEEKLIISEKEVKSEETVDVLKHFKVGDVVEGEVAGVVDFGAFVKLPLPIRGSEGAKEGLPAQDGASANRESVEGLIHISEFDYKLIDNPRDVLKVGAKVQAKIIGLDANRISLSLKQLKEDPWKNAEATYKKGDEVSGEVIKLNPFGAFVQLDGAIHALVHVSEFGSESKMKEALALGQKYNFKILSIEPLEHRMALGLIKTEEEKSTEKGSVEGNGEREKEKKEE